MAITKAGDFKLKPKVAGNRGNLYCVGDVIWCRFYYYAADGVRKEFKRSTRQTDERLAREVAWAYYCDLTGQVDAFDLARQRVALRNVPPIGKYAEVYESQRMEVSRKGVGPDAARRNLASLKNAVQLMAGVDGDAWMAVPVSALDERWLHLWRAKRYAQKGLAYGKDEDLAYNISLNSLTRMMRSVFSQQACRVYEARGLTVPESLKKWRSVPLLAEDDAGFTEIPPEVDVHMFAVAAQVIETGLEVEGLTLGGAVAYELARFCGLTRKEIVAARFDWVVARPYGLALCVRNRADQQFQTKGRVKNGEVPLTQQRYERWQQARPDGGHLLPGGTAGARQDVCDLEANPWIATHLPGRTKRLHELRKQAGWVVWQQTGSLSAAAAFLRDTEATARRYYLPREHRPAAFGVVGL